MRKWIFTSLEVLVEQVRKRNSRSFEVLSEQKFGKPNQSRQSGRVEATLHTFRSNGRAEVRKLNFISLAVKAGRECRSGASHLRKNWQSGSAERNSCHILGSQGRAEMRKLNFTSLTVKAVWMRNFSQDKTKCGSRTSDLWQSSPVGSAEAELYILDRPLSY